MTLKLSDYDDAFDSFGTDLPISSDDKSRVNEAIAELRNVEETEEEAGAT